jgi:alkanesulfonate monooxygenase SsuD/methylene tetrahydromethanopterin reductase-like flavin-dependent oxidoreductase (luciferase family)
VRLGLALPHYEHSFPAGERLSWQSLLDSALRAERLGFDSVWISDHFLLDLSRYGATGEAGSLEAFTALAGLAARTSRVRLGTLVACAAFRHPAILAKMATTIDLISGGRFDLGLGAGWYEREFEAFGYRFGTVGERFSALEDTVEAVAALFRDEPVTLDTPTVRLMDAYDRPGPAQAGGPPIWLGGKGGDRLLRLVAKHAAGWNVVWRVNADEHAERARRLREISESVDRDPATVRLSVGLSTLVGEDARDLQARYQQLQEWSPGGSLDAVSLEDFAEDTLTGPPDVCASRMAAFAENGVEEMIVTPARMPFVIPDWSEVELIAETLLPIARGL